MTIRDAAKAIIIKDDMILLNKHSDLVFGEYYTLPGGGQNQYETIKEAVHRECLEETGYNVKVGKFVGLYEEIYTSEELREKFPEYSHKIFHIYRCSLKSEEVKAPTELDSSQVKSEWIKVEDLTKSRIIPVAIEEVILDLVNTEYPIDLGSHYIAVG